MRRKRDEAETESVDGHGPHLARVRYKYPLSLLAAASHHCVISRFPSPASLLFRSPPPPPPMERATAAHPASSSVSAAHWMATEDLGLRRNIINNMCVTTRSPPSPLKSSQHDRFLFSLFDFLMGINRSSVREELAWIAESPAAGGFGWLVWSPPSLL